MFCYQQNDLLSGDPFNCHNIIWSLRHKLLSKRVVKQVSETTARYVTIRYRLLISNKHVLPQFAFSLADSD